MFETLIVEAGTFCFPGEAGMSEGLSEEEGVRELVTDRGLKRIHGKRGPVRSRSFDVAVTVLKGGDGVADGA